MFPSSASLQPHAALAAARSAETTPLAGPADCHPHSHPHSIPSRSAAHGAAALHEHADFWNRVADLSHRLLHSPQDLHTVTLRGQDLAYLSAALQQADLRVLPPDHHNMLRDWQTTLQGVAADGASGRSQIAVAGPRLQALSALLHDVLISSSRPQEGHWMPLDRQDREALQALGDWMCEGACSRSSERGPLGRQLMQQAAGQIDELHVGTDHAAPDLPTGAVLHPLIDSNTRAHVTLPPTARTDPHLAQALSALPLRTWRMAARDTLAWVLQQRPYNLRTLDLRPWRTALESDGLQLLQRAADELPNLARLLLTAPLPADALGQAWTGAASDGGWLYLRTDRPDGLALLDDAVRQWDGYIVATRQPLRRKASDPDAASLLTLAARLGQIQPRSRVVGNRLAEVLERAAKSDAALRRYAQALRQHQARLTNPAQLLAQVHEQGQGTGASRRTAGMARLSPPLKLLMPGTARSFSAALESAATGPSSTGPTSERELAMGAAVMGAAVRDADAMGAGERRATGRGAAGIGAARMGAGSAGRPTSAIDSAASSSLHSPAAPDCTPPVATSTPILSPIQTTGSDAARHEPWRSIPFSAATSFSPSPSPSPSPSLFAKSVSDPIAALVADLVARHSARVLEGPNSSGSVEDSDTDTFEAGDESMQSSTLGSSVSAPSMVWSPNGRT